MRWTKFGVKTFEVEAEENKFVSTSTGAQLHMEVCNFDAGIEVLLTGSDRSGKAFRRSARSCLGTFATMRAVSGLQRAWLIREDGTRKLLCTR